MNFNLKLKLVAILGCGLMLAFFSQLSTRYFFELPSLELLESHADVKDIERARHALLHARSSLIRITIDYAAWDQTYDVIGRDPGDPLFENYVSSNFSSDSLGNLNVDGAILVDNQGRTKFNGHVEKIEKRFGPGPKISPSNLKVEFIMDLDTPVYDELVSSGIADSNFGPILFAASHIVPDKPPYPSSGGTFVYWRLLDREFFNVIRESLQTDMLFIPIAYARADPDLAGILRRLQGDDRNYLSRDDAGRLYWLVNNIENEPVFLVRQQSDGRVFNEELLSPTVLVSFAASAFILLLVVLFFSRSVIVRLVGARNTMEEIVTTGDYEKRLAHGDGDEIDTMFAQFNHLLERLQTQNRELLEQNRELAHLTEIDALTGIANRRSLDNVISRSWRSSARAGKLMSVLMVDVDFFKRYNDSYGHPAGDKILRQIAQALQDNLHRATDYVARYGGEEFCVVLSETDEQAAFSVAERLRTAIEELGLYTEVSDCAEVVTVSIGVATLVPDAKVVAINIIEQADTALYEAKRQGKNRVYMHGLVNEVSAREGQDRK